ncbi:MAG: hypothetical protein OXI67_10430 [Candidatus Poribacteria bacterium]|nr:hypothetical protein [Candidatus Poribacteria bacterium]
MKMKKTLTLFILFSFLSLNAFAQVQLEGTPEDLYTFALSPDGETLAGCNFDGTIHLWDTATGTEKDVFISEFRIGASGVLTFSPDGTLLASGSEQSRTTLWDVATGKAKFVFEHVDANTISSISFSPDGTTLASCAAGRWGTRSTFVYLWDVETGEKKSEIELPDFPTCSTYSPDGTTLAIGTLGEDVYLWDIHENIEIARLSTRLFDFGVRYVEFSPDGTTLAAGGHRNRQLITLWDVVTREETGHLFGYYGIGWIYAFAFSPDGMILAGPGRDGFYLWNVSNEERRKICEPPMFAGVSSNGTIYAVENQYAIIDEHWVPDVYFLWTISPENVPMEVAAHDKLTTSWGQIKQEQ